MSIFWERYTNICAEYNVKPRKVAAELGFSSSTVSDWRNGRVPRMAAVNKIAARFNVPVEYFVVENSKEIEFSDENLKTYFISDTEISAILQVSTVAIRSKFEKSPESFPFRIIRINDNINGKDEKIKFRVPRNEFLNFLEHYNGKLI